MKKLIYCFIGAALLAGCASSDEPGSAVVPAPTLSVEESEAAGNLFDFGLDLFQAVVAESENHDNIVMSPLSASMVLSMAANVADATTTAQICTALGCKDIAGVNALAAKYMSWLPNADANVQLSLSNSVWYDQAYTLNPDFSSVAEKYYQIESYARDFNNEKAVVNEINGWASRKTNGVIDKVIDIAPEVGALFNALYFKGMWSKPFKVENTIKADFKGETVTRQVDMMKNKLSTYYLETEEAQIVWLYIGSKFSVCILLPKGDDVISGFVADKLAEHWPYLHRKMGNRITKVDLSFPKFEISSDARDIRLTEAFENLGVMGLSSCKIFSEDCPMSIMGQKATVRFDEKGAEAAAVTGNYTTSVLPPKDEVTMTVDRPFLFFINENSTDLCLFAGKVSNL